VADLPRPALLPRSRWQRIPIDTRGNIASAFAASAMVPGPDGLRREWIAVNLKEPIPLPETGGHAASVTFLADYRCDRHAWDPIETIWHPRRDAGGGVALREQPRARGARVVQEGTLIDVFLDAACRR
jgi:hypothetical protein